jgi:hypothetical protein
MSAQTWTNADFDAMSWHDVHVHGFRLVDFQPENGTADLAFDLDYIMEWIAGQPDQAFRFKVAQGSLRFHDVFGLRVTLDYKAPRAGMTPFSLDGISRRKLDDGSGYAWELEVNWPSGKIEFEASGFTQSLVGPVLTQGGQSLAAKDRL